MDEDIDDLFGKIVATEDEAYELYNRYAFRTGFSIRKNQKRRNIKGEITALNFCCSREGKRIDHDLDDKKADKLDTRCECLASIRFSKRNYLWEVTLFNRDHSHAFALEEERQFLRSNRKITKHQAGVIRNMIASGVSTKKVYSVMAEEVGGAENVGFTKTDCYNLVAIDKAKLLSAGDAQTLCNTFKRKKLQDPTFFYHVQYDQENRMTNIFWTDGRSQLDYECFGDVVVFDTTFRTNKYNMKCAPFVGVNHHWKNILFGCAFLLDEKTESFVWLFETFLDAMGGRKPQIIFTDEDAAMASAIKMVLPDVHHRLCLWHIIKNATKHIGSYLAIPEFKRTFNKCLFDCESEAELEQVWWEMIKNFNLQDNSWLKVKWVTRHKWSPVYSMDLFSCMMKTSQRSESMNSVFRDMCKKTMTLTQFVNVYEQQSNAMRLNELQEDYHCSSGQPSRIEKQSHILNQAASIYTRKLYKMFEKLFIYATSVMILGEEIDGTIHTFQLRGEGDDRVNIVRFNSNDCTILCSCRMFEQLGLLCRHALRVFNVKNVLQIPEQYIKTRWTKCAKNVLKSSNKKPPKDALTGQFSASVARNSLIRRAYSAITKGSENENIYRFAELKITELEQGVDKECGVSKLVDDVEAPILDEYEAPILDPHPAWPKGLPNVRLKSSLEKSQKKPTQKKKQQKTIPTSNATYREPSIQEYNMAWDHSSSNFGFTGTHPLSFTSMLQGTLSGSHECIPQVSCQNSNVGFPSTQYGFRMYPHLSQNSNANFPSNQYGSTSYLNSTQSSNAKFPTNDYESGQ